MEPAAEETRSRSSAVQIIELLICDSGQEADGVVLHDQENDQRKLTERLRCQSRAEHVNWQKEPNHLTMTPIWLAKAFIVPSPPITVWCKRGDLDCSEEVLTLGMIDREEHQKTTINT
jgi:hypothetical protein